MKMYVVNYPSEKIWQSRDRIPNPPARPYHRNTNAKFRVVCGEGFLARKRMATPIETYKFQYFLTNIVSANEASCKRPRFANTLNPVF